MSALTEVDGKRLYKVLSPDGQSQNSGSLKWSLPDGDKPGEWHECKGEIRMCYRGLHLTSDPLVWWAPECRVFEVEAEGLATDRDGAVQWGSEAKVVARRVRLTRELRDDELASFNIFRSGYHETTGKAAAEGSASVRAYGSASVSAYGSASVSAYDSASVRAYDSASVSASGSASVRAYGSASVSASGSASVSAHGSASVSAYGSASASASGSASVSAYDSATAKIAHSPYGYNDRAKFVLEGDAVCIDRRSGTAVVHLAVPS